MTKSIVRIVNEIACEVRDDCGAKSLSHVLVVVPTAESGRRLRLELARRFKGGVLPPEIRLPDQMLFDPEDPRLATRSEELIAFWEARGGKDVSLDVAAQFADLRRILSEKALAFADVAEQTDFERERWQELSEIERRYLESLHRFGKLDRIELMKEGRPLPVGVEKVLRYDRP